MAIIRYTKDATIRYAYLNIFPDQFKTEKEKMDESWIKNTMDYFSNKAYAEYVKNRDTFVKNYDLMKGILRMEDFYQEPEVRSFTDVLTADLELPAYVKMYSIVTTPVNELVGDLPFIVFRKSQINITKDFRYKTISQGTIYILEKTLSDTLGTKRGRKQ